MAISTEEKSKSAADMLSMGALIIGGGGVAAIVLTILGLANVATNGMLAVATIVIGVAFILQGMETVAEYSAAATNGEESNAAPITGGVTSELLVGGAGIILGILSLVAVSAMYLVPAALITFGAALLLTGFTGSQGLPSNGRTGTTDGAARELVRQAKFGASGAQVIVGISAIILGILAYILPNVGQVLALVGLLAVGASLLVTSAAETSLAQSLLKPARWERGAVPTPGE